MRFVILFPHPGEVDGGDGRFLRGETEIVLPTPETLRLLAADKTIEVHRFNDLSLKFIGINTGTAPLDDVRVRRAIASAIDGSSLAALDPEMRREAQGILPPGLPSSSPASKKIPFDREVARRLLADAGHPGGRGLAPLDLYATRSTSIAMAKGMDQLRNDLGAVGITLTIHEVSWRELDQRIEDHAAPLFQIGWVADLPDPDAFLRTLFEPGSSANYFDFLDHETARTLERGASEMNPVFERTSTGASRNRFSTRPPLIPLYHSVGVVASRRTVHGLKPSPLGIGSLALERVWIDAARSKP
jgi:ABC-type transport system substrate-binding protein